ncbi:MAG: AAA family ATPase [Phascolarctobacterium sp.]|nr:AAA family ATPase [Phascolarctobacterium sp.]
MGMFLNPDNGAFQVALNSKIYVDKTGLISYTNKVINTLEGYICNSRPRRFGKSITANMLVAYYSKGCDSREMFSTLEISKKHDFDEHLNKYDVIHLDIQWCLDLAGGVKHVVSYITQKLIEELREYYPDILTNKEFSLSEALSSINIATNRKFVVIIDEWDVLIRDEASNLAIQEEYINFLRSIFKGAGPTKFIALAFLTGILPIKKYKTQSALNNFDEYTMTSAGELAPYIGFTEHEVKQLCQKYDKNFLEVKRWYDGYCLGNYHVYNPKAVVSLMLRGTFQSYWTQTGTYESILPFINMDFDGLKASIIDMLAGNSTEVIPYFFQNDMVSFKSRDDILALLIHLGYLSYDEIKMQAYIPNEEIRFEFAMAIKLNRWSELLTFTNESLDLLENVVGKNEKAVAEAIEKIHNQYSSMIQYNNENALSSTLAIAFLATMEYYFKPIRELPTGRGFADFIYLPKPEYRDEYPALVVELKWNKSVTAAIEQIKAKKYPDAIMSYTGNILLVGINYDKRTKEHTCSIEAITL